MSKNVDLIINKKIVLKHKKKIKKYFKKIFKNKKSLYTFFVNTFFHKHNSNYSLSIILIELYRILKKVNNLTEDDYFVFSKIALYKIYISNQLSENKPILDFPQSLVDEFEVDFKFKGDDNLNEKLKFDFEPNYEFAKKAMEHSQLIAKYFISHFKINEISEQDLVEWIGYYGAYSEINWHHISFKKDSSATKDDKYNLWLMNHFKANGILQFLQKKLTSFLPMDFNHIAITINLLANKE